MKKTLVLSLIFLTCAVSLSAQLSDSGALPEKYRSIFLGFDPRTLIPTLV